MWDDNAPCANTNRHEYGARWTNKEKKQPDLKDESIL